VIFVDRPIDGIFSRVSWEIIDLVFE